MQQKRQRVNPTCTNITIQKWGMEKIFDILTLSSTDVLWIDRGIKDSIPEPVAVPANKNPAQ